MVFGRPAGGPESCSQLPFHIHALVQDSDDGDHVTFDAIEDDVFAHGVAEVPISYMVAIPTDPRIRHNQMEGLIQPRKILLALLGAPSSLRVLGYIHEICICLVGKLESHSAVQLGKQLFQGISSNATLLAFDESELKRFDFYLALLKKPQPGADCFAGGVETSLFQLVRYEIIEMWPERDAGVFVHCSSVRFWGI